MAGAFDDLIAPASGQPAQPAGPFGDIVAAGQQAAQAHAATVATRREALRQHLPSVPRGIANAALSGLTFGFDDEISAGLRTGFGFLGDYGAEAERQRLEKAAFAEFHPYLNVAGEVAGAVPTMFVPGVGVPARAVQAGRTAGTVGQFVAQGARTGAKVGALSGMGNADPGANANWFEAGLQRVIGAGVGGTIGAGLGAGLGSLASGGNNLARPLRQGSDAAAMLQSGATGEAAAQTQALRDIAIELRRDAVDPVGLVRNMLPQYRNGRGGLSVNQIENVIAGHLNEEPVAAIARRIGATTDQVNRMVRRFETEVRPRFDNQNILEIMRTPSRPGEVVAIPNTTSLAYQATRSEGRGQQVAQQRLLQRQADEADQIANLIGDTFGSHNFEQTATAYREMLQGRARQMYSAMYANNQGPVIDIAQAPALRRIAGDPVFRNALEFAAREAAVRGDEALAAQIAAGSLDARAVDLVQRQLRRSAQSLGDPNSAQLAGTIRSRFLAAADTAMPEFWGTRGVYRLGTLADEALDLGRTLSTRRGGTGDEAWRFFTTHNDNLVAINREIRETQRRLQLAGSNQNAVANLTRQLQMAEAERALVSDIVNNFRQSYGAGLLDELNRNGNANRFLTGAEARVFRSRVEAILGPDARPFLDAIASAQQRKLTMRQMYGNSETAPRLMKALAQNPIIDTAAGIATMNPMRALRGAGDMVSARLREARYDRIASLLSETDMRQVFNLTRMLRDNMQRSQLPNSQAMNDSVMGVVRRLPAPLRARIQSVLGDEFRGQDLLTFLSRVLSEYATASTYRAQRQ